LLFGWWTALLRYRKCRSNGNEVAAVIVFKIVVVLIVSPKLSQRRLALEESKNELI
jgi:hypothetical protein